MMPTDTRSTRGIGDSTTRKIALHGTYPRFPTMTRYFMTILAPDARAVLRAVRAHWEVENGLHWVLDASFREDESRVPVRHVGQNLALVRKFALNLLRREQATKGSVRVKRKPAGWNPQYLLDVLGITL